MGARYGGGKDGVYGGASQLVAGIAAITGGTGYFDDGTATAPSIGFASTPTMGLYRFNGSNMGVTVNNVCALFSATGLSLDSDVSFGWAASAGFASGVDAIISRAGVGVLQLHGTSSAVGASLRRIGGNAGYVEWGSVSENLTLSTSGTTTDTTANLLPANSYIESVTAYITTTIATATNWAVGDPTTAARFNAANATLTAGTTSVGLVHFDIVGAGGPRQTAAAKVRITTTGTPSAGAIRLTSYYRTFVAPTS